MVASRFEEEADVKEAMDKVAALSPEKRDWLLQELARMQDDHTDMMSDEWLAEMRARLADVKSGKAKLLTVDEARERVRQRYSKT